jgi:hypothetical protein
MRRISMAIALSSGLVAAGCSGGSSARTDGSVSPGMAQNTFTVTIQNGQAVGAIPGNPAFAIKGGRVTSLPAGIDCGEGYSSCSAQFPSGTSVALSAAPLSASYVFVLWSGDCGGDGACALEGAADRYVVALFRGVNDPGGHPNYTSGLVHGPKAYDWLKGATGALDCRACHGANLQGVSIAPSCKSCHATLPHIQLDYTTFTTGPSVTAACVKCHTGEAKALLSTNHFTWMGSSTSVGHTTPGSIGKRNVINNFCVANASNESRCMQCHPSYSSAPTKSPVDGSVTVNTGPMYLWSSSAAVDLGKIDCLVCHGNLATSKYMKSPAGFGQPWPNTGLPCTPACSAAQICSDKDSNGAVWSDAKNYCRAPTAAETSSALNLAANSIGAPQRANCGFCHFNAGGGDNVKMGDLGSALKAPTPAIDVHMGSTASYAPQTCVGCHESGGHGAIKGSGLSIPVDNEGRLTCTDCHSGLHAPDHSAIGLPAVHLDFIACQTCHIPKFSRTQYTKMDWDWQTTADKQACQGLPTCVGFNVLTYPAGGAQTGTVSGVGGEASKSTVAVSPLSVAAESVQTSYDWKKGIVIWAKGVTPAYRFIAPSTQQQGTHETTVRNGLLGLGTPADPYRLSDPLPPPAPVLAGWKIAPFKKMTGRTPVFADQSAMIVPHVFGPDSLWQNDLRGFPVVGNTLGSAGNPWTQAKADAIWTGVGNYGAAVGGQLGAPVAKASGGQMTRDAAHLVTVNTLADLPATFPATLFLIGAEAAFPTGVKAVTKTGARQFTYTETIPYTVNTGTAALPALPATSTQFVAFYTELKGADWAWANTVMFINLNHEVAPKASALACADCHSVNGRMKDLYSLQVGGCEDPANCSKR